MKRFRRRFIVVVLSAVFFFTESVFSGTYSGGTGLGELPYLISTVLDWQELMATPGDWGSYFILTTDINLTGVTVTPVGNSSDAFYGVFDGNGHKISHAVIDPSGDNYVGLFGNVEYATISNLGADPISVTGYYYVGGLAGYTYGAIISGCFTTGTVNGYNPVGGLVGYSNFDSITNCYSRAAVTGDSAVGGLVGGDYDSSITTCFSTGLVGGYSDTGGLVGWSWKNWRTTTACFWDTETSGTNNGVGSANPDPAGVSGKTTVEMKTQATFTDADWDFADDDGDAAGWKMQPDDYPHLQWEVLSNVNGQGTEMNPYLISSAADFLQFADNANAATYWAQGVYTRLEADLNLQGVSLTPIGGSYDDGQGNYTDVPFEGHFEGNHHIIFGATLVQADQEYIGLFGMVGTHGVISRLGVENVTATGLYNVGGLAGSNKGTIRFCYTTGQITGTSLTGGLAGYSYAGTITSCYSKCSVSGYSNVGGLVGHNLGSSIADSYSTGLVSGSYFKGGLIGSESNGTVSSCFWDTTTSNQPTSMGGEGRTTAQMKTLSTFTIAGWDFDTTWFIPNNDYPRLWWEPRYSAGQGTADNPYQISSTNDWQQLISIPGDWNKYFILTADLDFTGINLTPVAPDTIASTGYPFEGIRFTGFLDGQGHTLRHVEIYQPNQDFVGLFGSIGTGGQIKNLNLENISVTGRMSVGSLAGENYAGTIIRCTTHGTVNGSDWHCGGLVGESNGGSISQCSAKGTVNGDYWVGGLAGYLHNDGTINSCSAAATVNGTSIVGGLVGFEEDWGSSVMDSYSTGTVTATTTQAGGLVGRLQSGFIQQSYSTGDVFCPANAGALLGYNASGSGTLTDLFWNTQTCHLTVGVGNGNSAGVAGRTTAQMKMLSTFPYDFELTWAICEQTNYPRLRWQITMGDFACPDGVALEDLQHLAAQWLAEDCSAFNNCAGADLDLSEKVDLADFLIFAGHWLEEI
jgi:hypothetical protein